MRQKKKVIVSAMECGYVSAMECGVTITEVVVGLEHFLLVLECRFGLLFHVKNI